MKNLLLLSLMTLSLVAMSQENNAPKQVKFKIGAVYSPDYCYRLLKAEPGYKFLKEYRDKYESPLFGHTTGISFVGYLNKHIGLETGVYYTKKGFRVKRIDFIYYDIMPNDPPMPQSFSYTDIYNYLEIPVKLNYRISKKRMTYFMNAGLGAEVFLKMQQEFTTSFKDHTETETKSYNSYFKKMNLSAILGLGVGYNVTEKFCISLEPVYTQFITSIYKKGDTEDYPYALGARVGVQYQFY